MGAQQENADRAQAVLTLENLRADQDAIPSTPPIDGNKPMAAEITTAITRAIKDKYGVYTSEAFVRENIPQAVLAQMTGDVDLYDDLNDEWDDITYANFDPKKLMFSFHEADGDLIADFNLEPVLKPFLEKNFEDKILQRRRAAQVRGYDRRRDMADAVGQLNLLPLKYNEGSNRPNVPKKEKDEVDKPAAGQAKSEGQADPKKPEGVNVPPTPPAPEKAPEVPAYEEKPSDDMLKTYEIKRQKRENVLTSTVRERPDIVLKTRAELDPAMVRDATDENPDTFDKSWRNFNNFSEMEQLMKEDYAKETGYSVNPFVVAGFNTDALKDLIKQDAIKDNTLSFDEISTRVFTDRYYQFKEVLTTYGVTEECFDLLESDVGSDVDEIDDPLDEDTLLESFQKVSKNNDRLSNVKDQGEIKDAGIRKLYPYKEQIKNVTQVLGDYCAAITTLINYLQNAKLNVGEELEDEKTLDKDHSPVAVALRELFLNNNGDHNLRRYDDELHEVLGLGENPPKAKFKDLNGNVAFVDGDWFNQKQSAETAYKLAYEAAQPPLGKNGEIPEGLDPEATKIYINHLLNIGATTIPAIKANESIGKIIEDLKEAGVTVPPDNTVIDFKNDPAMDQHNLYKALEVHRISELTEDRVSPAPKAKFKARHLLMRVGSVVYQKEQEQANRDVILDNKRKTLNLKKEQVASIMEGLKATGKFNQEELQQVEQRMLLGIMLVGNVKADNVSQVINGIGVSGGIPIDLGHDVTLTVGGAAMVGNGFGLNAGIGKKFTVEKGTTITLSGGPGINFGEKTVVGLSGNVSLTKELESCDLYVEAGTTAGFDVDNGKLFPGFNAAVGFNRTRAAVAENYKASIDTAYSDAGINKLDAMTPEARYEEVLKNPTKYPGLGDLALRLKQASTQGTTGKIMPGMNERIFADSYEAFKKEKREHSMQEAVDGVTFAGLKLGVATTVMPSPFPPFFPVSIPTPNIGVEFNLWKRKLTYISTTPEKKINGLAADAIQQKIIENLSKQGSEVMQINGPVIDLKSSGTIVYLPGAGTDGKGEYVLSDVTAIDFSQFVTKNPDQLGQIKQELAQNAGMSVKEAKPGQLTLTPYEAHGQIDVYADPSLPKDVYVTWKNGDMILSAPNNANLKIARFDKTLPLQDNGVVEISTIVITDKNNFDFNAIQQLATHRLTKFPGRAWVRSRVNEALNPNAPTTSAIVDYTTFTQDIEPTLKDRVQSGPVDDKEYRDRQTEADKALLHELTRGQATAPNYSIDPRVKSYVERLEKEYDKEKNPKKYPKMLGDELQKHKEDIAVLQTIKAYITEGYVVGKNFKPITSHDDIQSLERVINVALEKEGLPKIPNHQEFAFVIRRFTDATFLQFDEEVKPKDRDAFYKKKFENYDMPMFIKALEADPDPTLRFTEEEGKAVRDLLMANLSRIDFNATPEEIKNGTFLMQDVGNKILKIKGEARYVFQNVPGARNEGVLGRMDINTTDAGITKKLAQYLIRKNSPYKERTAVGVQVNEKTDAPIEKKREMAHEFRSIFSQRVMTVLPAMLTDVEMHQITKFVHDPDGFALNQKDHDAHHNTDVMRFDTINKVLGYLDTIRAAELAGQKTVKLSENFEMHIMPIAYIGAYSVCTNYIKALEDELFVLVGKETNTVRIPHWTGAMTELAILAKTDEKFRIFAVVLGLAVPIPRASKEVGEEDETTTTCEGDDCPKEGDGPGGIIGEGGDTREGGGDFRIRIPRLTFKVPNLDEQPKPIAGVHLSGGGLNANLKAINTISTSDTASAGLIKPTGDDDTNVN